MVVPDKHAFTGKDDIMRSQQPERIESRYPVRIHKTGIDHGHPHSFTLKTGFMQFSPVQHLDLFMSITILIAQRFILRHETVFSLFLGRDPQVPFPNPLDGIDNCQLLQLFGHRTIGTFHHDSRKPLALHNRDHTRFRQHVDIRPGYGKVSIRDGDIIFSSPLDRLLGKKGFRFLHPVTVITLIFQIDAKTIILPGP